MKNSNEANRSTNQTPSECKHYHEEIAACEFCGYHTPKCANEHCPDYQPKQEKDNESNRIKTRIR